MPIGLDDAQEEADKTILESRDDALCYSDSGGLRLLFQAPYLSVGTAGLSTVCESNIGRGPFRYLNGGSEYHPQIIWQWKKLPLLQSSIGSKEWLREQHLYVRTTQRAYHVHRTSTLHNTVRILRSRNVE